jgi:hypothetical protein
MNEFIAKYADKIMGTLSCFDRVLFRGYLPLFSGAAMAAFVVSRGIERHPLKGFLLWQAALLKDHARRLAQREDRRSSTPENGAQGITCTSDPERDRIHEGLVCVFSTLEPCRSYALRWDNRSYIQSAKRKCLFLYYYFMDSEFGLIHVRLQTWFPLQIQVYVNGREWLARKLAEQRRRGRVRNTQTDKRRAVDVSDALLAELLELRRELWEAYLKKGRTRSRSGSSATETANRPAYTTSRSGPSSSASRRPGSGGCRPRRSDSPTMLLFETHDFGWWRWSVRIVGTASEHQFQMRHSVGKPNGITAGRGRSCETRDLKDPFPMPTWNSPSLNEGSERYRGSADAR